MQQSDTALVGFGFRQLKQGANLESFSISCMTSLAEKTSQMFVQQLMVQIYFKMTWI